MSTTKKGKRDKNQDKDEKDKDKKEKETPSKEKEDSTLGEGSGGSPGGSPPKPQSAGASARDAAQRILVLTQKGEWSPIDNILKQMERAITQGQVNGEEVNTQPLAGVADPVSSNKLFPSNFSP